MDVERFDTLIRSLIIAVSRRGVLAGLASGLFAAGPFVLGGGDAEAKKDGKPKRKRRKKRKNQQQPPSPPPPPPGPITRVDAVCLGPGESGLGSTDGDTRLAQTFTALASGALVRVELSVVKEAGTNGEYIVRLSPVDDSGFPTNEVLAETSVSNLSVPAGPSTVTFTFANPAAVVAGTEYALVLTRPGFTHLQWEGLFGDTCAGSAFVSTDQTAAFVQPSGGIDLIFTTFVTS